MTDQFMRPEISFDRWIEIDGSEGITAIPFDHVYTSQNSKTFNPKPRDVSEYYQGEVFSVAVLDGYGARLSAPGYLDCTDWCVFSTRDQAQKYLTDAYNA